jgi:5-methylcytosine-specific restriction endonuclease McrA
MPQKTLYRDLPVGTRFTNLVIVSDGYTGDYRSTTYLCECDCGKRVPIRARELMNGSRKSCGCRIWGLRPDEEVMYRRVFSSYQTAARGANRIFTITFDELVELVKGDCFYCGAPPELKTVQRAHREKGHKALPLYSPTVSACVNGIDRFINKYGYVLENLVSCCWTCNRMKGNMDGIEFLDHIKRIAENAGPARWGNV